MAEISSAIGMAIEILPIMAINWVRMISTTNSVSLVNCAALRPFTSEMVEAMAAAVMAGCLVATVPPMI